MKKKKRNEIIQEWGKPKEQSFNFDLINQYSNYKNKESDYLLKEKTLVDIDFYSFFKFVDRTKSAVGSQFLFHKFVNQNTDEENIEEQENYVNFYNSHSEKKVNSQFILSNLCKPNDFYFPYLIFSELPAQMYKSWIILCLQVLMLLSILLTIKYPVFFIAVLLLFAINLSLHYLHKNRIGNFVVYFSRLSNLSNSLRKLIPLSPLQEPKSSNLISDCNQISKITSTILFLKTDDLQNSEFGSFFWFAFELLKILTLSEIVVFNKLVNKIDSCRPQIENVYKAIGEIDIAISICSLRDGLKYYSIPTFIQKTKKLDVKDLYHPLVTDCVSNNITLNDRSLLLTGSNMAGKSTFIKALNINALSAQVLNTSYTSYYEAPVWQLMTSMTIKDNLDESSSYYLEEVYSIGELIKSSEESGKQYLFTIDEIFKGTNTIERISTAKAILEYLNNPNNMVLVSTHDIELTKLLSKGYDLYFFQESIDDSSLSFNYQLNKGTLKKSNAIKLLEICGYPKGITDEARDLAIKLAKEKTDA